MRIKVTDNQKIVEEVREALKKTGGYCPCSVKFTEDTRCPCKSFRENAKAGEECYCGLYVKVEE